MARKRSLIILPKLKNCGGDLSKKWYVEYSCRDPQTNEMKRFRHYDGFAELETVQEREAYAEKIISEIKLKLEKGEDPFCMWWCRYCTGISTGKMDERTWC